VADAYEPTVDDFRKIRTLVRNQRRVYETNYRELRHHWFAHKVVSDPSVLFAKTNIGELKRLLALLISLYRQLWALFFHGSPFTVDDLSAAKGEDVGSHISQNRIQPVID
jgi:hypothetical protein